MPPQAVAVLLDQPIIHGARTRHRSSEVVKSRSRTIVEGKPADGSHPGLVDALDKLDDPYVTGDPLTQLRLTFNSLRMLTT